LLSTLKFLVRPLMNRNVISFVLKNRFTPPVDQFNLLTLVYIRSQRILLIRRKAQRIRLLLLVVSSNLTFSLILVEVCLELADQELREVRVVVLVVHNYLVANHYARFLVGLAH